jgi:hypothetical protein
MNFILNKNTFNIDNLHFLEYKNNIIMDGNFSKLFYSDSNFIINNIFIDFEIIPINISELIFYNQYNNSKFIMYFDINENIKFIEKIIEIEENILKYYLKYKGINKSCEYILKNQILNKNLKFFRNNKNHSTINKNHNINDNEIIKDSTENYGNFYIKISGIWENNTKIGITYKIVEYF